jgi:hypothetical protein
MAEEAGRAAKSAAESLQEVESELELLLKRRVGEIEQELEARILKEKEAARLRKEEIEREFQSERQALSEFRLMVREAEEERGACLEEIRERLKKVLHFQAEIESLTRSTVDEIRKLNEAQKKLEELRERTAEKAAFLKKDLRERFGIVAEILEEREIPVEIDLDREIDRLRRIKELLSAGSSGLAQGLDEASLARLEEEAGLGPGLFRDLSRPEKNGEETGADEPRLPAASGEAAQGRSPSPSKNRKPDPAVPVEGGRETGPGLSTGTEAELDRTLEPWHRVEITDGGAEVHYYRKESVAVVDVVKVFEEVWSVVGQSRDLVLKLDRTDSPREHFFLKQELIHSQELVRGLVFTIVKNYEKGDWSLPRISSDIASERFMRGLLERLSIENWTVPGEFLNFEKKIDQTRQALTERIKARPVYLASLKQEIDA